MKFAAILGIIFWSSLYITVTSTTERENNPKTKPNDDALNVVIEKGPESDKSDMLRGENNNTHSPARNHLHNNAHGPARNCLDIKKNRQASGVYKINPCDDTPSKVVEVYCDMDTDGGGWTVIQRRDNYPVQEDFYKTWSGYAIGFGDVTKDFWLGNENIHCLTRQSYNEIRFDLTDWTDSSKYAKYGFFYVHDEAAKFKLEANEFSGTAGDSLAYHYGSYFSTSDKDNDASGRDCASTYSSAWWYKACYNSNLNGVYNGTGSKGINWNAFKRGLKKTEMKIRPKNN